MKPERCAYCGDMVDIPFECTYCKDPFCDEHRLPEDHRCVKLTVIRAKKFGEKIRISGGGKCNFTNTHCGPDNFISSNPRFCISALNQYTKRDFIDLIESQNIPYHEKKLGQLFCDRSAKDILALLKDLASKYKVDISLAEKIIDVKQSFGSAFIIVPSLCLCI